ncbi:hydroxymethylglutaryl-CoA reductase, degradative [Picrophilus oshimae]|uniref:3-hydroxy-3-methylglutaryl-coenzyme A reductase n=1 Tax=Picrophilus torridus (strain ATCC 700027 / DSM 9790 / JCM 10055 / NBRC 100828 / KAW 2/3) TaxID=1122961 RepID=A0A8G2FXQ1_PICTO|nr:hydroxymethylglutaryl-CoA reductase, degradative [Picrophilus oshimae]SMD31353.1 3-hydroxy-3-methylglutaryl-coenzyme A reductase [Picrophilus oshimae DSM 9789]
MESNIHNFHKMSINERLQKLMEFSNLTDEDINKLSSWVMPMETADHIIENVVSRIYLPMGIATNFLINGRDYLIPMAIEEPSVVAACSNGARIARAGGGFTAYASEPMMYGQIQIVDINDPELARINIMKNKARILEMANTRSSTLKSLGAGAKDLEIKIFDDMMIIYLKIDVQEAMGANIINTMCEYVSPFIEEITKGRVILRIMSNLTPLRMAYARAVFPKDLIGERTVDNIIYAYKFAEHDVFRAATHNKGIMNGIDAVLLATLNDFRAQEANAHAYASLNGYKPLTRYYKNENGDLVGSIEIPVAIGTVGGTTRSSEISRIAMKILNVENARDLSCVLASVGLSQNFAALRALADEGIQRGHMKLHARNVAIAAGATGDDIDKIADKMIRENKISITRAMEILKGD